jgi:ABC-type multidrug transport system fused ATPase/permease subunit
MFLQLQNITFKYNTDSEDFVFDDHNITLDLLVKKSGLFGIIGPSGTGKTTLLSMIGGQLKPLNGKIFVDSINVYQIIDSDRQNLITIQLQTSTSLRGKLDFSVRFGILDKNNPSNNVFSDEELIDILKKVGLWNIFEEKEGLNTLIGEGGLNLSGGQRLRLNFAALYLRSKYYKPKIILIDEPTSSLDEISEKAITAMIDELSKDAVTIVVVHRLKTLDKAQGLLDTSLIKSHKTLEFLEPNKLLKISNYYQDLISE